MVEPEQQADQKTDDGEAEKTEGDNATEKEKLTKSTDERTKQADESVKNETKSESESKSSDSAKTTNNTKVTTKLEVVKELLEVEIVKVDVTPLSTQAIVESKTK